MLKFVIFIIIAFTTSLPIHANQKYEVRATWLTTLGGMDWPSQKATSPKGIKRQKAELCAILDKLQAANFNTVLFQTRLRGDVIYPSYFEGYAECLTGKAGRDPGYDPLQFAIDECHKRGMALHAWIVTIPIGSKKQVRLLGRQSVVTKNASMCKLFKGNWYLDPGNPATSDYLSNIVKEIVARYDVDGIHFDYMRYPEHGKLFPDYGTYRKYGKKKPLEQWRRENITRIVKRLYKEIKDLKPWVIVSSAPIGKYNDTKKYRSYGWNAYQEVHQDAQLWLKEGIHDAIFPMMYFRDNHFYPFVLDWEENKNERWVVPGMGIYFLDSRTNSWNIDDIIRQIYFSRDQHLEGQAYFRNRFLMHNTKGIWDELTKRFYTTKAVTPPLTWLDNSAPAVPTLLSFEETKGKRPSVTIRWRPSATKKPGGIRYHVYASNTYPVNIEHVENIIATNLRDSVFTYRKEFPWEQKLYWAITATDRYGNESLPLDCNIQDNQSLPLFDNELPKLPPDSKFIISDITGRDLLVCTESSSTYLKSLPSGIYQISLLSSKGEKKLIGTLVR